MGFYCVLKENFQIQTLVVYLIMIMLFQGIGYYEVLNQFFDVMKKFDVLEREIIGGIIVIVVLVYKSKLYVVNVGKLRI